MLVFGLNSMLSQVYVVSVLLTTTTTTRNPPTTINPEYGNSDGQQ